jgi:hypothetical protein
MSTEPGGTSEAFSDLRTVRARQLALRLAFGVTTCFATVLALGWDASFLAPLLAAQMLVKLPRPPGVAQGAVVLVLIKVSTLVVLTLTTALRDSPVVFLLALALLLYLSFYAHQRGAPELATLLLQISVVSIPVIAVASPDQATGFAEALFSAGVVALLTVWAAFAAFPDPQESAEDGPRSQAAAAAAPEIAARGALLDTLVLLPLLAWFVLDATELAVVVLIVAVTILRQRDSAQSRRAGLGLVAGNFLGGVAAVVAYNLVLLWDAPIGFVVVCLVGSLVFAGRIVTAGTLAPLHAIAFATFILLLGLGITPLPGGSGEAFVSRLLNVLFSSAYVIGALAIVEPWRYSRASVGSPPVQPGTSAHA